MVRQSRSDETVLDVRFAPSGRALHPIAGIVPVTFRRCGSDCLALSNVLSPTFGGVPSLSLIVPSRGAGTLLPTNETLWKSEISRHSSVGLTGERLGASMGCRSSVFFIMPGFGYGRLGFQF